MSRMFVNSKLRDVSNWLWKLKSVSWTVTLSLPGR